MINYIILTITVVFGISLVGDNECENTVISLVGDNECENTVFYEVSDSTGTIHLFRDLNEGSNYCWQHQIVEELVLTP